MFNFAAWKPYLVSWIKWTINIKKNHLNIVVPCVDNNWSFFLHLILPQNPCKANVSSAGACSALACCERETIVSMSRMQVWLFWHVGVKYCCCGKLPPTETVSQTAPAGLTNHAKNTITMVIYLQYISIAGLVIRAF